MKKLLALMCALVILFGVLPTALASEQKPTVKVGFVEQKGLLEVASDGSYRGYSYEYIMKIAQYANWNVEFVFSSEENIDDQLLDLMAKTTSGEIDIMTGMLYSDDLKDDFSFPQHSYGTASTCLKTATPDMSFEKEPLLSREQLTVAVVQKDLRVVRELEAFLQGTDVTCTLLECGTLERMEQAVGAGEADALLSINLQDVPNTKIIAEFATRPFYFVSTPGNTRLCEQIDRAITNIDITQPNFRSALYESYFAKTEEVLIFTQEEQQFIREHPTITALIPYTLPPLLNIDSDGSYYGIFLSFANYLQAQTGMSIHFTSMGDNYSDPVSWERYDMILGVVQNYNYALNRSIIFSEPLISCRNVLFYNRSIDITEPSVLTYAQAETASIQAVTCADSKTFRTVEDCLAAVAAGQADFGYGSDLIVNYHIANKGYRTVATLPTLNQGKQYCVAFSAGTSPEFISIVNKLIRTIDTQQMNTFLEESAYRSDDVTVMMLARQNPLAATLLVLVLVAIVAIVVLLCVFTGKLRRQNLRLLEVSNAKSEFLSRMSHDMRTPMNGIIGLTELSRDLPDLPEEMKKNLNAIDDSSKYLLSLINDTLDMNKIESQKLTLNPEPVFVQDILDNIFTCISPMANAKHIHVEFVPINLDFQYIFADKMRLEQVFINVLSNAVKFTPEDGTIRIEVECLKQEDTISCCRISVADNGIGMSPEFLETAFEPFSQENTAVSANYTGTGLGLSIVKNIVELMGGTIRLESTLGKGTRVTAYLDFRRVEDYKAPAADGAHTDLGCLKGKRILLCEDHPLNTQIAVKLLQRQGMEVTTAENGQIGVETFEKSPVSYFDAILMDVRMPVMDGLEATKAIRRLSRPDAARIPIIAMTANAFTEDRLSTLEAGMNAHLSKPIEPNLLYCALAKFLQSKLV